MRKDSLNDAKKALKLTEGVSGALPVVGTFVGAVAKVGLTVTEMLQVSKPMIKRKICRLSLITTSRQFMKKMKWRRNWELTSPVYPTYWSGSATSAAS